MPINNRAIDHKILLVSQYNILNCQEKEKKKQGTGETSPLFNSVNDACSTTPYILFIIPLPDSSSRSPSSIIILFSSIIIILLLLFFIIIIFIIIYFKSIISTSPRSRLREPNALSVVCFWKSEAAAHASIVNICIVQITR